MTLLRRSFLILFVLAGISASFAQPGSTSGSDELAALESLSPQRNLRLVIGDTSFNVSSVPPATGFTLDALTMYHLIIENKSRVTRQLRFGRNSISGGIDEGYTDNLFEATSLSIYDLEQPRVPLIVTSGLVELALPPGKRLQLQFRLSKEKLGTWEIGDFGRNDRAGMAIGLKVN